MNKTGAVLLVLCVAVLAALYVFARPRPPPPSVPQPTAPEAAERAPPLVTSREFDFEIAAGKVRGPAQLIAQEGEQVALRVRSDVADELHVHGYDLGTPLPAGEEVVLRFVASKAGRFEVELHGAHRELGALEVHPR
jgi:hypothetical protein